MRWEPNSLQVVRAQVQLALVQDDLDGALAHCNQLIGRLPTAESYILRGGMYAEVGQFEEAEADYQRAIDVDPNNAETWFARYRFHRRARQTEKLLADVDQLLVLDPTNVQYLKEAIGQYINSGIEERTSAGEDSIDSIPGGQSPGRGPRADQGPVVEGRGDSAELE